MAAVYPARDIRACRTRGQCTHSVRRASVAIAAARTSAAVLWVQRVKAWSSSRAVRGGRTPERQRAQ